ncbi:MAG: ATP-binding cassette domain-containing protein, partial [Lachnospiraceae bacterium]|nr:ATP-binding cassette domain-containing protein [Lachnospiraceae bacterium]
TMSIGYDISEMNSVKDLRKKLAGMLMPLANPVYETCEVKTVELQNVSFAYDRPLLENVNLSFEQGKKYLLMGENGSGKSTLLKIIGGLQDGYSGEVLINGTPAREDAYNGMGIVLQEPYIFNDTLLHNLDMYRDIPADQLKAMLRRLKMEKFATDKALNEEYSDTKNNLSGGEKQKLALARVLLRGKKFILLDEFTSAMDAQSSHDIEKMLLEDANITLIHVQHKVDEQLIKKYDEVIKLS